MMIEELEALLSESQSLPDTEFVTPNVDAVRIHCPPTPPELEPLYPYQVVAADLIESMNEDPVNIMCACPTGSGKSYLIERAAQFAVDNDCVVMIAEPLIALASQMYVKLRRIHDTVCLLTGPVCKNDENQPNIYVCTYEVIARMTCVDHPDLRLTKIMVIDEFHFLGTDRGPVIQEILQSCRKCNTCVVALSGSLPNDIECGNFLSRVNGLQTVCLTMDKRPIELKFYFWDYTTSKFSLIRRRDRTFVNVNVLGGIESKQDLLAFIRAAQEWECFPLLIVAFSCKRLSQYAENASCLNLLDRHQKSRVTIAFDNMLRKVPPEDKILFSELREQALRGVFQHHSQLHTLYLELVSELAVEKCTPIVFSSSTLSAGINLPVRTVAIIGIKVPQKHGFEIVFEPIDPMLFFQLCGRAGRPGFETLGNVIIVGKGACGYASAQALMGMQIDPVRATPEFGVGDLLRSIRSHRCIALDALSFNDDSLQDAQHVLECSTELANRVLKVVPDSNYTAEAMNALERANPAMLRYVTQTGSPMIYYSREHRGIMELSEDAGQVVLQTPIAPPSRMPIEFVADIMFLRKCVRQLLEPTDDAHKIASAIVCNYLMDGEFVSSSPVYEMMIESQRLLLKNGLITEGRTLTKLGEAAIHIRSCPDPSTVVNIFTSLVLDAQDITLVVSMLLCDGVPTRSIVNEFNLNDELWDLLKDYSRSEVMYTKAIQLWYEGGVLVDILSETQSGLGTVCRHINRVQKMLLEIEQVLHELDQSTTEVNKARDVITHGLPFA